MVASSWANVPIAALAATASLIRATDDARPAASGSIACGKMTASRSGSTEMISGTAAASLAPSAFSSSAMWIDPFRARSEQIDGLQLTRGRPHQRFAASPALGIRRSTYLVSHVVREVLDLALHVQHASSHL